MQVRNEGTTPGKSHSNCKYGPSLPGFRIHRCDQAYQTPSRSLHYHQQCAESTLDWAFRIVSEICRKSQKVSSCSEEYQSLSTKRRATNFLKFPLRTERPLLVTCAIHPMSVYHNPQVRYFAL